MALFLSGQIPAVAVLIMTIRKGEKLPLLALMERQSTLLHLLMVLFFR